MWSVLSSRVGKERRRGFQNLQLTRVVYISKSTGICWATDGHGRSRLQRNKDRGVWCRRVCKNPTQMTHRQPRPTSSPLQWRGPPTWQPTGTGYRLQFTFPTRARNDPKKGKEEGASVRKFNLITTSRPCRNAKSILVPSRPRLPVDSSWSRRRAGSAFRPCRRTPLQERHGECTDG
jgi:hypothetical protein